MKYRSIDRPEDFEFHDAVLSFVELNETVLRVTARHLNVHKGTAHNDKDWDMEIEQAEICFSGLRELCYEPGRDWHTDEKGVSHPVGEQQTFRGAAAIERVIRELKANMSVFFLEAEKGVCRIGGCGEEPYLEFSFCYDKVIIEWEAYRKKAWYELHRRYKRKVCLLTLDGEETAELAISVHEEDVWKAGGELVPGPSVTAGLTFGGKQYWGEGKDHQLWIDAIGALQRQLPEGVKLKCCDGFELQAECAK